MPRKLVLSLFLLLPALLGANNTIDFEGPANGAQVANFYAGITFTNAVDLKKDMGLNPLYPPYSGISVAVDEPVDPMMIEFATPVKFVGAVFTYFTQLTLVYYDAQGVQIGTTQSMCNNQGQCQNFRDSGSGIAPNLWIPFFSADKPIAKVVILTGSMGGDLFAIDNLVYGNTNTPNIPEPATLCLMLTAGAVVVRRSLLMRN